MGIIYIIFFRMQMNKKMIHGVALQKETTIGTVAQIILVVLVVGTITTANKKGRNQEPMTMIGSAVVVKESILLVEKIAFPAKSLKEIPRTWFNTEQVSHKSKKDGSVPAEFKILRTGVHVSNVILTSLMMP